MSSLPPRPIPGHHVRATRRIARGGACAVVLAFGVLAAVTAAQQPRLQLLPDTFVAGTSVSPFYVGTDIPFYAASGLHREAVRMLIRSAGPQCRMWVLGPPSASTVTRQIRTLDRMWVAAAAAGTPTHVTYGSTFGGMGIFSGVQVDQVAPHVTSVVLTESFTNRRLYEGGIGGGQIIAFPTTSVSWTGFTSPAYYGIDGGAIAVSSVWTVREQAQEVIYAGTPTPGQEIVLPGKAGMSIKLVPNGCSVVYALVVPFYGGGGGGGVDMNSWAGTWSCKEPRYPAMQLTIVGQGLASRLSAVYPDPARDVYTITQVSPNGDQVSGTYAFVGPDGRPGSGRWRITFGTDGMQLVRQDNSSIWVGTYQCVRSMVP